MQEQITETAPGEGWFERLRSRAAEALEQLTPPTRAEEQWRFTDLADYELGRYPLPGSSTSLPSAKEVERASLLELDASGRIFLVDGAAEEVQLAAGARSAGVVFTTLEDANTRQPELLEQHLGRLHGLEDHHAASSLAHLRGGSLLYVPPGVQLDAPLVILNWTATSGARAPGRALVIAGQEASVTVVELHVSSPLWQPSLSFPVSEIFVGAGAKVRHAAWQDLHAEARHLSHLKARVERDGRFDALSVTLGGHSSRTWTDVALAGPGAESRMQGACFLDGEQKAEHWTVQDHQAPNTTSDLLYAVAASDTARSLYNGTIRVAEGARGTNAYQSSRNLLRHNGARAHANPQLEIVNNDVRCTHGATVGPLDEEALFYLRSRGIPRPEAERLMVLGFMDGVLEGASWSGLRQRLAENIRRRMNG